MTTSAWVASGEGDEQDVVSSVFPTSSPLWGSEATSPDAAGLAASGGLLLHADTGRAPLQVDDTYTFDETLSARDASTLTLDTQALVDGEYSRLGRDLLIEAPDGHRTLITDFFAVENPPILQSADGVAIKPHLASLLAGPEINGQYAQAGAVAGNSIGEIASLDGSATAQRADGTQVTLAVGTPVFEDDVISTADGSKASIRFIDGTALTMSANARMVLDEVVYDPAASDNSMVLNLVQGGFVFVTGQIAKTGTVSAETPVATMGIRGTTPVVQIESVSSTTTFGIAPDPDGTVGAYQIINLLTGQVLGTVSSTAFLYRLASVGGQLQQIDASSLDLGINDLLQTTYQTFGSGGQNQQQQDNQDNNQNQQQDGGQNGDQRGELNDPNFVSETDLALLTIEDLIEDNSDLEDNTLDLDALLELVQQDDLQQDLALLEQENFEDITQGIGTVLSLNGQFTLDEDTNVTLNGFTVQSGAPISVALAAGSTVTLATTVGLTFTVGDGVDDEVMVFTGSPQAIQNALNGAIYTPSPDSNDGVLNLVFTQGGVIIGTIEVPIAINPVDDAPVAQDDLILDIPEDNGEDGQPLFAANVLADNGNGADGDVDGDAVEVSRFRFDFNHDGDYQDEGEGWVSAGGSIFDGGDGVITIAADGTLLFVPGDGSDSLSAGQSEIITGLQYEVVANGKTDIADVTLVVTGQNDAPEMAGGDNGQVTEYEYPVEIPGPPKHVATGEIAFTDVDLNDSHTVSVAADASGYVGKLTAVIGDSSKGDGEGAIEWQFSVNDANINFLGAGQQLTQTYTLTLSDGRGGTTMQTVTITINGADDPAVFSNTTGAMNEDDEGTSGNINYTDADANAPQDVWTPDTINGEFGDLTISADGSWEFTPSPYSDFSYLNDGEFVTEDFTVKTAGDETAMITITINGVGGAPQAINDSLTVGEDDGSVDGPPAFTGNVLDDNGHGPDVDPDEAPVVTRFRVDANQDGDFDDAGEGWTAAGSTWTEQTDPNGYWSDQPGQLQIDANGDLTFTPGIHFQYLLTGETDIAYSFIEYEITSGGEVDTATVDVTVVGADDPDLNIVQGTGGDEELYGTGGNDLYRPGDATPDGDRIFASDGDDFYDFSGADDAWYGLFFTGEDLPSESLDVHITGPTGFIYSENFGNNILYNLDQIAGADGGLGIYAGNGDHSFDVDPNIVSFLDLIIGQGDTSVYTAETGNLRITLQWDGAAIDATDGTATEILGDSSVEVHGFVRQWFGTSGDDSFSGSDRNEIYISGTGNDVADGGTGFDTMRYDRTGVTGVNIVVSTGTDAFVNGNWNGQVFTNDLQSFEEYRGARAGVTGFRGSEADETFVGRGSNNYIEGGGGNDTLYGSGGSDLFVYDLESAADLGTDTIHNFTVGQDRIDLSLAGIGNIGQLTSFTFDGTSTTIEFSGGTIIVEGVDLVSVANPDDIFTFNAVLGDDNDDSGSNALEGTAPSDRINGYGGQDELFGEEGNDILISGGQGPGNESFDFLDGGDGDDWLIAEGGLVIMRGGAGDDTLVATNEFSNGGNDTARADYQTSTSGIVANLSYFGWTFEIGTEPMSLGGVEIDDGLGGKDTVSGIHQIRDSNHDDYFRVDWSYANSRGNYIDLRLGAGNDTVDVSDMWGGQARISYQNAADGITVNLEIGSITDLDFGNGDQIGADTIYGWNSLDYREFRGSAFDDEIVGSYLNEVIDGYGGNDILDGQGGTDTVTYASAGSSVHVDLSNNTADKNPLGPIVTTDELYNFENVIGSAFDDVIIGDDLDNLLAGGDGNDILNGGLGNDYLIGGNGADTFVIGNFSSNEFDYIQDFSLAQNDVIDVSAANLTGHQDFTLFEFAIAGNAFSNGQVFATDGTLFSTDGYTFTFVAGIDLTTLPNPSGAFDFGSGGGYGSGFASGSGAEGPSAGFAAQSLPGKIANGFEFSSGALPGKIAAGFEASTSALPGKVAAGFDASASALPGKVAAGFDASASTLPSKVSAGFDASSSAVPGKIASSLDTSTSALPGKIAAGFEVSSSALPGKVAAGFDASASALPVKVSAGFDASSSAVPGKVASSLDTSTSALPGKIAAGFEVSSGALPSKIAAGFDASTSALPGKIAAGFEATIGALPGKIAAGFDITIPDDFGATQIGRVAAGQNLPGKVAGGFEASTGALPGKIAAGADITIPDDFGATQIGRVAATQGGDIVLQDDFTPPMIDDGGDDLADTLRAALDFAMEEDGDTQMLSAVSRPAGTASYPSHYHDDFGAGYVHASTPMEDVLAAVFDPAHAPQAVAAAIA